MKRSFIRLSWLIGLVSLNGCRPDGNDRVPQPEAKPIPTTVIQADSTDFPLLQDLSNGGLDNRVDGEFLYQENYFVTDDDYRLTLTGGYAMASYEAGGYAIRDSRVNGQFMCVQSHNDCDSTKSKPNGRWSRVGRVSAARWLTWEHITIEKDRRYRLEMNDLPKPIRVLNLSTIFPTKDDYTITFTKASPKDSLLFELLFIPKTEFNRIRTDPFVNHNLWRFRALTKGNQLLIPGKMIEQTFSRSNYQKSPNADTAFVNVATLRRVIKIVGDKKIGLTYQINDYHPVRIQ